MILLMTREVTLPRFTLLKGERLDYRGELNRQSSDDVRDFITYGGGKILKDSYTILLKGEENGR